jgi:hypothetical protein
MSDSTFQYYNRLVALPTIRSTLFSLAILQPTIRSDLYGDTTNEYLRCGAVRCGALLSLEILQPTIPFTLLYSVY